VRVLSLVVTAVSVTVLSRLLAPAEFGVWAVAALALGLATVIREFGLVASIIQAPLLSRGQRDAYFWTSVGVSLATAALLALSAPLLSSLYGAPDLPAVIWACCISVVLSGFGLVHAALLRREMAFGKVAILEGGAMLCGLVTSLACAFLWRDVWALVAGHIASALWMCAAAWVLCRWAPRVGRRDQKRIDLAFGFQVTVYNLLTYAANNIAVLAGYRFGSAQLGFFNRAQQLYLLAHFALLTPLTETAFALLCRLKSREYRHAYVMLARRVSLVFIPCAAVLPILSNDLIIAVLGRAWEPAAPVLAWFAPAIFGQALAGVFAQLMTSQGRGQELRRWALADLVLRGTGAGVGAQFGLAGLAAGFSLSALFAVPAMIWIAGRSGPVTWRDHLVAGWPGAVIAVAVTGVAAIAALGAQAMNLESGWIRLCFVGGGAAIAWGLLCLAVEPARRALLGTGRHF
jgi:PST family polysaccharide transporter